MKETSSENRARLRLLGRESIREVVVVVASILIAFGLDAWWDGVSERRQLREQLAEVVRELEAGEAQLEEALGSHRTLGGAARLLRQQLIGSVAGATVSVSDTLVGALFSHFVIDVSTTGTTAFIDAGGLTLLDRDELARALRDWPERMADLADDEAQLRLGVQSNYQPYMMSAADLGNALQAGSDMIIRAHRTGAGEPIPEFQTPPGQITLRVTPQLVNLLSWRAQGEGTRERQVDALLNAQRSLISELGLILAR